MHKSILQKDKSYTFSDYFNLSYPTKEIVAEFGYTYELQKMPLPHGHVTAALQKLKTAFYHKLPRISLTSEAAKREVLVAPILLELMEYIDVNLDIEYPVYVNDWLKGNIDYLLRSTQEFVVVEAKNADMEKGFSQLAVELIAMEQYLEEYQQGILYGAVTVGNLWQFGALERTQKRICKDIDTFRIPSDLEELFPVLLGILAPSEVE
ncbi:hypothetical protein CSA56_14100 [candidate division KSB3 bacterium]|uniref:Type I restriction enzyme R protein N-terminal domain-containing protein n=1 Tax=candidate division KSB3 bacterium TaxID=2044937 RepID=A0A2G6KB10_9BACT|nr:MAG: hypothetical protein CSA56_14100 [candidate division KSB3 bacterium]